MHPLRQARRPVGGIRQSVLGLSREIGTWLAARSSHHALPGRLCELALVRHDVTPSRAVGTKLACYNPPNPDAVAFGGCVRCPMRRHPTV